MPVSVERTKVFFNSGETRCAAWYYPGRNGACVIMASGLGVTKEPGTDLFAKRFNDAGFSVLAFDYRHLGESGGHPRQIVNPGKQLADWRAAILFAETLPQVDPGKLAIWGFSFGGGHTFPVAALNPQVAAAIAYAPTVDASDATRNASRSTTRRALMRFTGRAILDAVGMRLGRAPLLVPLAGEPGTVAALSTSDALKGDRALNPGNKYPEWQQAIAASSAMRVAFYKPGKYASRTRCPLLVLVYNSDNASPPGPAIIAAGNAPRAELVRLSGGHYEGFLGGFETAFEAQLTFLLRHLRPRASSDEAETARDRPALNMSA